MRHETKESLLERESKFYARDIMTRELSFVNSEDSVRVAATRMEQDNVGFLLVRQEETGRLFGILTDRDLVTRVLAADRDPNTTKVRKVATREVVTVFDDENLCDVEKTMIEAAVRRVVVLDRKSMAIVGVLSVDDIAARVSKCRAGEVVRSAALAIGSRGAEAEIESPPLK